ncbi:hypothetical protein HHK36_009483 [Tetracentron sinense]|uniref:Synaptonemal complex protein 1 n=1 Tax=Tetracentron sinense TaxID=13715 RepID=A0A835DIF8_TETSI|nr:hypothetical protein HHK36_009483 [Tetracentron sinense]
MMHKLGFSGMKSLDQFRSLSGSVSGTAKTFPLSSRSSSDSVSSGSFANLKLTAEKLVKEQASVKTDLDMANMKLKKSAEQIHTLEEKVQNTINENAKLKVKQKEDAKLWKGLESKFSSTKTLCDQLTETLQYLAGQVQDGKYPLSLGPFFFHTVQHRFSLKISKPASTAEQDRKLYEDKLSASSKAFDSLHLQMNALSVKLDSMEEIIRNRDQELMELRIVKEEREKSYRDEHCRTASLIEEKDLTLIMTFFTCSLHADATIKQLEGTVEHDKLATERINSQLEMMHFELSLKEDVCTSLRTTQENLEKEKSALQSSNEDLSKKVITSCQEIKSLEDLNNGLVAKLIELDKHSLTLSDNVVQLNSAFDTCYMLVQQDKEFAAKHAQKQYDQLHDRLLHITSEKSALLLVNQELKNKVIEMRDVQEGVMVQHAEECRLAEERIRRLESEAETLLSKKIELEMLVTKSEEKIENLSESSSLSENKMRDLLLKCSALESENQDIQEKLQVKLQEKVEEVDTLQKEIGKHEQHIDSLEKQVSQLCDNLDEKEQINLQCKNREKQLEDKKEEIQALLAAAESKLAEAKKQYDLMLESKQSELSKHLKEISQRNDQAINDIRRKYEVEKLEILNLEKEKADRVVGEMERKCDQKLTENKEESRQYLMRVQEEHTALINCLQQEHGKKESNLRADHCEELKHVQLQAEDELREKTMSLRKEHEVQIRALRCQHEDESRKLQEELELQKSKEERQRALLQLQWKVMDDNPKEDQEVNSKKDYSISSIKMRDTDGGKRSQLALMRPQKEEKDSPFLRATQTPVTNLLKKVKKPNTGSIMSIPKHSRKVTHREYEVETSNGRTITKRRKTKSTVMFEDPTKHKKMETPKAKTTKDVPEVIKGGGHSRPSNIGDLFTEGSLNPYADDPYAFD